MPWRTWSGNCARASSTASPPAGPPSEPTAPARRARDRLEDFTGGDPDLYGALDLLRAHVPPDGLAGWDAELLAYLYEALAQDP